MERVPLVAVVVRRCKHEPARRAIKMNITGRDAFIMREALATAIVALEQVRSNRRPWSDMEDMKRILADFQASSVTVHLTLAKCRLNPALDWKAVFRSYGM